MGRAVLLVAAIAAATPAFAQSPNAMADAQRRFRTALEQSDRAEVRYITRSDDEVCATSYSWMRPGMTAEQSLDRGFRIQWGRADRVINENGRVSVYTPGGTSWPIVPSYQLLEPLMAAANDLIRLCRNGPISPRLGQAYQVTGQMVWADDPGTLRQFHHEVTLRGRPGERYRFSWQGTVPVSIEFGAGYEVQFPSGATIFDLSSSATITLQTDQTLKIDFTESGLSCPRETSSSLAGPSLAGCTPRAFIPFTLRVDKLN